MTEQARQTLTELIIHGRRWGLGVVLAALALGFATHLHGSADDALRVQELELVDTKGTVRARLELRDNQPVLSLLDQAGRERLSLEHTDEQTALFIRDSEGTIRLGAAQFAHGGGGYALHGLESRGAAVLYLKGGGSLSFYDIEGQRRYVAPPPAGEKGP